MKTQAQHDKKTPAKMLQSTLCVYICKDVQSAVNEILNIPLVSIILSKVERWVQTQYTKIVRVSAVLLQFL